MSDWQHLQDQVDLLQKKIGITFHNPKLLLQAFVHKSYLNENDIDMEDNERLEFLGDSIFNLLVTRALFQKKPEASESELSLARSFLVDAARASNYLNRLEVASYLVLGKGERQNLGRARARLYANLFEAILGAILLDQGFEKVEAFFIKHFSNEIDQFLQKPLKNWKMELQDWAQKNVQQIPVYNTKSEQGPSHEKHFVVEVIVEDKVLGIGEGPSKKIAQMEAARNAMGRLQ